MDHNNTDKITKMSVSRDDGKFVALPKGEVASLPLKMWLRVPVSDNGLVGVT